LSNSNKDSIQQRIGAVKEERPRVRKLLSVQVNPVVILIWVALFLFLAFAPRFMGPALETDLALLMLWICLAESFNLFTGLTGYVNFGMVAFYGIGGYGLAMATTLWNMPPLEGVLLGGIFSALLALGMSFPTLRLRGAYFAIATLGIEQAIFVIFDNWNYVNSATGLTLPIRDYQPTQVYYTMLVVTAATVFTLTMVMRSKLGMALSAIRQQEETALSIGVNATLYKTLAFVLSGFFAGLGGATWFWNVTIIDPPGAFDTTITLTVISMAMLGGLGTLFGPALGAAILYYVENSVRANYANLHLVIFGIIIIVVVLLVPEGIMGFVLKRFRGFSLSRMGFSKSLSSESRGARTEQFLTQKAEEDSTRP
jgi:branched-chain amino acid transport system permease protein